MYEVRTRSLYYSGYTNVSGTGEEYLDLAKTQLLVKAKITKANGTALDAETKVGPVNLFLHSLFSQVDVSLNERIIFPID